MVYHLSVSWRNALWLSAGQYIMQINPRQPVALDGRPLSPHLYDGPETRPSWVDLLNGPYSSQERFGEATQRLVEAAHGLEINGCQLRIFVGPETGQVNPRGSNESLFVEETLMDGYRRYWLCHLPLPDSFITPPNRHRRKAGVSRFDVEAALQLIVLLQEVARAGSVTRSEFAVVSLDVQNV